MRTEFVNLFRDLNRSEMENLTGDSKKTLASPAHIENAKPVFTAANLWNIHNMKRTREPRKTFIS
ncbi:MAG TPA: hypothetical protein VFW07_11715 [Parafilimonas sp.]|nr:hypothetical protein [Parafilimonas sp.]